MCSDAVWSVQSMCLKELGKSMTAFRTGEGKLFKAGL